MIPPRTVRAPRGRELSCRSWQQEAALRMLMNNLDPEVAERPDDLVVYGGIGRAARNWDCFDAIVAALRALGDEETLLVQSGKPVGVFRTHRDAPRVLIANSMLVPAWATWEHFYELDRKGLMMYGQMTAGSWIYIGTQGILQGTYETFAEAARQHFGGSLRGRLVLTAGLGGMGGAQPLAATMNEGVLIGVEVDRNRIERRLQTRYLDSMTVDVDGAVARAREAVAAQRPLSIGLLGNAADVLPELLRRGVVPDLVTDQTSAHDPLNGYVPNGMGYEAALALRAADPGRYMAEARRSMAEHVRAMLELKARGSVVFDYGNNIRAEAQKAGVANAFDIPGFVPAYIRPLFCEGKGPFRWACLSGDLDDIAATDDAVLATFPHDQALCRWIQPGPRAGEAAGPAGPHLLARLRRAREDGTGLQRAGAQRPREGADRDRPRPPRRRLGRLTQPGDRGHARRLGRDRRLADPQRPAQRRGRRDLGLRAPRRRGRHRLLDPRRHGGGGRRHGRGGRPPATRADDRPGHRRHAPRRRRLRARDRRRARARGADPAAAETPVGGGDEPTLQLASAPARAFTTRVLNESAGSVGAITLPATAMRTGNGSARSFWITTTLLPSGLTNASWFS